MSYDGVWRSIRQASRQLQQENLLRGVIFQSAAIAFFSLFSMAPVLIVAVAVAGVVFGEAAVEGEILAHLQDWLGADSAGLVQSALAAARPSTAGLVPAVIGLVVILFGATTVFVQIRFALNSIWQVSPDIVRFRLLDTLRRRLLALAMVLLLGAMLILSLLSGLVLQALYRFADAWLMTPPGALWFWVESAVNLVVLVLAFAWVQKLATDVHLGGWKLWPGAVFSALLFALGRYVMAQYLTLVSVGSAYGAAGTLVVGLVWLQYSAAVFLLGAAFNYALTLVMTPMRNVAGARPDTRTPMDRIQHID